MAQKDRVVLIDGSAMLYRAFFAIPGNFSTASGLHTNAIYGFALMFKKLLAGRDPKFGAVVFDAPGKTFRDEQYPAYKAHRPRMPSELREQLAYIDDLVVAHNFPLLRVPGYEADDIIGTYTRLSLEAGHEVVIVSGDKDFAQLIGDDVRMLDTLRDITYDVELVKKKWGVPPEQFVDYLALVGDKADNIPGVAGIGQKGAAQLLEKHGSLDAILAAAPTLKGRQKTALTEHADDARMSQSLGTIDCHVPLPMPFDELALTLPEQKSLNDLYKSLEFYSLLEKDDIEGEFQHAEKRFGVVSAPDNVATLLDAVAAAPCAVHPLFDAPSAVTGVVCGFAFCQAVGEAAYVPLNTAVQPMLKQYFEDAAIPKIVHNAKALEGALAQCSIELRGVDVDLMLASYLIDPTHLIPHQLSNLSKWYLHRTLQPVKSVVGAGKKEVTLSSLSADDVFAYACHLAEATFELHAPVVEKLDEQGHRKILDDVDTPLSHLLSGMEQRGILIDKDELNRVGVEFQAQRAEIEKAIFDEAGKTFNLNSPKQLSVVLFEDLGLPVIKRTKSGYSTNAEVLERLSEKHTIAQRILAFRKVNKLINTYTDVLQRAVNEKTGRVHATFQQTVAATGRLISTEPDLQRTPIKTPEGKRIRRAFIAPPGHKIVSADWSQIELRILADRSEDPLLVEAFANNLDVHSRTAGQIFGKAPEDVTPQERGVGKTINFATIYGQGATALSQQLKIPRKDAQRYIDAYFEAYQGVRLWLDSVIESAMGSGFVMTLLGRRRYIPELSSNAFMEVQTGQRMAANTPIQGSAADICKLAMLAIEKRLRGAELRTQMVLQIHDELLFEAPEEEVERVCEIARDEMESVVELNVPLVVDVGVGRSWAEAH